MTSKKEAYVERIFDLFEKHRPGKYNVDYVNKIVECNKGKEHKVYLQFCGAFNESPLPKWKNDTVPRNDKQKKEQKNKKKNQKDVTTNAKQNQSGISKNKKLEKSKTRETDIQSLKEELTNQPKSPQMIENETKSSVEKPQLLNEIEQKAFDTEFCSVKVIMRLRPDNWQEKQQEVRLMFKNYFDMDEKDFRLFMEHRRNLIDGKVEEKPLNVEGKENEDSHNEPRKQISDENRKKWQNWTVDDVCKWLDEKKELETYKKRFRRHKVNGEFLKCFPVFQEKKPLEIEYEKNSIIHFGKNDQSHEFELDKVIGPQDKQAKVYDIIGAGVVENILKGYNVTLFAYGQTGTGKTHTMFGYDSYQVVEDDSQYLMNLDKNGHDLGDGLIPRIFKNLFNSLEHSKSIAFYSSELSILEIYNEKLKDLIRPKLKLTLRYVGMGSEIEGLSSHPVNNEKDCLLLIEKSKKNRVTASTNQNDTSSRSHCIVQTSFEITLRDGTRIDCKLNLADLAGSEKITKTGAQGTRLKEAQKIVQSLFGLKKVIRALSEKKAFIPYQDSLLTKILRDSLGGNSHTTIICTGSLHEYNREETISTLRFAEMARKINNEAIINRVLTRNELTQQLASLKEQLTYMKKKKASRSRFTSTDFRLLQAQLNEQTAKAEELESKYLNTQIQLIVKTQYTQELEAEIQQLKAELQSAKQKSQK